MCDALGMRALANLSSADVFAELDNLTGQQLTLTLFAIG